VTVMGARPLHRARLASGGGAGVTPPPGAGPSLPLAAHARQQRRKEDRMSTPMIRENEFQGSTNQPQPPPPRRPAVEAERQRVALDDARALWTRLGDLLAQRDRELEALRRQGAELREQAYAERETAIRERAREAAERLTEQLERLRSFAAAQLAWHSPEGRLRRAIYADGAAELAFARRVERASVEQLVRLAEDAYHHAELPSLRVIGDEAAARGGEAEVRVLPLVQDFAAALVESDPEAELARQLAEAVRAASNAHARLTGRQLQLSDDEIDSLSQSEYERLRREGLL